MIRPFTLICMLLACGSGLYLYQTKHRVQLLDREIARTVQSTTAARDRAGVLRTEWTLLNDLERLRTLADQYLPLRPIAPSQFTTLTDLGNRLPPPRVPEPVAAPLLVAAPALQAPASQFSASQAPVLQADAAPGLQMQPEPGLEPDTGIAELPMPPMPPIVTPAPAPRTQIASIQTPPTTPRPAPRPAPRAVVTEPAPRPAPRMAAAAPVAIARAAAPASQPVSAPVYGSAPTSSLGMAARTMLPPPVPVAAYQYTSPN